MTNKTLEEKTSENFNVRIEARIKNANLVRAREELGWNITEAAEKMGISQQYLGDCERLCKYPSEEARDKICSFYGLSKEEVFPGELRYTAKNPPKKFIVERYIPKENIISLSAVNQKLLPSYNPENEILERLSREKIIPELLKILNPKQKYVVKHRFGLDNKAPYTLEKTAEKIGCTKEYVRVIENKALKKIRRYTCSKQIYGGSL